MKSRKTQGQARQGDEDGHPTSGHSTPFPLPRSHPASMSPRKRSPHSPDLTTSLTYAAHTHLPRCTTMCPHGPRPSKSVYNDSASARRTAPLRTRAPRTPYATRKSTQERRPGVEAGLAKRSQVDIQAAAAKRAQDKKDRAQEIAREKSAAEKQVKDGMKRLAALQDQRARDDAIARKEMLDVPLDKELSGLSDSASDGE